MSARVPPNTRPAQCVMVESKSSTVYGGGRWYVRPLAPSACVVGGKAVAYIREDGGRFVIIYWPEGRPSPGTRYNEETTLDAAQRRAVRWIARRCRVRGLSQ